MDADGLREVVDEVFTAAGGPGLRWADPHPDRQPGDEEYSRVLDPGKYRILLWRTDAWTTALTRTGLASTTTVDATSTALWRDRPPQLAAPVRSTALRPRPGRVPLLLCLAGVEVRQTTERPGQHTSVLVGASEPAVQVDTVPDCGCDACDSGSDDLLEVLDRTVLDVVSGALVHITTPEGVVCGREDGWSASGRFEHPEVEDLLVQARAGRSPHAVVHGPPWW